MQKILFSVHGDGIGDAIRSLVVIKELEKRYNVHVTASLEPYNYLKGKVKGLTLIEAHDLVYEHNEVMIGKTLVNLLKSFPRVQSRNIQVFMKLFTKFKPNIIFSVLEPFSTHFGMLFGIPVIEISHPAVIVKCKIDVPFKYYSSYLESKLVVDFFCAHTKFWIIPAIGNPKPKGEDVKIFPPILRDIVYKQKPSNEGHILVYQHTNLDAEDIYTYHNANERFIIYGTDGTRRLGNLEFKKFSEKGFIKDMASAKAIVTDGDFGVISEALHFRKPILNIPVENQFLRILNSGIIKKKGLGDFMTQLSGQGLNSFIRSIPRYRKNLLKRPSEKDNKKLLLMIDWLVEEYSVKDTPVMEMTSEITESLKPHKKELTMTIIKPDAVKKNVIGEIIAAFEKEKIRPISIKMMAISKYAAQQFYSHLKGKIPDKVFNSIIDYMTSGKVVLIVWEGKGVVKKVRKLCGPTDPQKASRRTLRGKFSDDSLAKEFKRGKAVKNVIHSSEDTKNADREIEFFFKKDEIV